MTSSVSHELITPLKCIICIGELTNSKIYDAKLKENSGIVVSTAGLLLT